MPARLSDALPRARLLRHDLGILRASPRAATRHNHQLHEPGRYKPATTQGETRSAQQQRSCCSAGLTSYPAAIQDATQHSETHGIIFELFP